MADNKVKKYKAKAAATTSQTAFSREIRAAEKDRNKWADWAHQAEMGYLEHMWHLRNNTKMGDQSPDDLYATQTELLDMPTINRPVKELEDVPTVANNKPPSNPTTNSSDDEVLEAVKVEDKKDDRGDIREVKIKEDTYEIVEDSKGRRKYYKNGKSITKLTYEFETKRRFGEILENVKIEDEQRRGRLLDLLRKKVEK